MIARFLAAAIILLAAASPARAQTQGRRAQTVAELYTSQGCTQCPRANRLLGMFARDDGVLALTFPVAIWDYLGWRDTYARPEFAERQRAYSQALRVRGRFTPQLVINGARQMSASDWDEARAVYNDQRRTGLAADAPNVTLTLLRNSRARVTIDGGQTGAAADVWLLSYDPGPVTIVVTAGVNRSRTVSHYNLVTSIDRGWANGMGARALVLSAAEMRLSARCCYRSEMAAASLRRLTRPGHPVTERPRQPAQRWRDRLSVEFTQSVRPHCRAIIDFQRRSSVLEGRLRARPI
ncbi:MAG: DUF1223 domain-containing protein [Hyphomonadaceae bacterium]